MSMVLKTTTLPLSYFLLREKNIIIYSTSRFPYQYLVTTSLKSPIKKIDAYYGLKKKKKIFLIIIAAYLLDQTIFRA